MQSRMTEQEFADYLNNNEAVQILFRQMLDDYKEGALNIRDLDAWQKKFAEQGCNLSFLGDPNVQQNNKVFRLSDQNGAHSVILHISIKDGPEESMRAVIQSMDPMPDWANHEYADFSSSVKDYVLGTQDTYHLRVVKSCEPLTEYMKDIQHIDGAHKMQFISGVTENIVDFLDDVRKLNGFFTDLKEGNVLVDPQLNIQMVDAKSLVGAGNLRGGKSISFAGDTTPGYTSPSFQETMGRFPKDTPIDQLQGIMQQEYSYQLGILLHRMITGDAAHSPMQNNDGIDTIKFDFNLPVFKFGDGPTLQKIIEGLTHDDPSQRMHIQEAKGLIGDIANKLMLQHETEKRFGKEQHGKGVGDEWKQGIDKDVWSSDSEEMSESKKKGPPAKASSDPGPRRPKVKETQRRSSTGGGITKAAPRKKSSTAKISKKLSGLKNALQGLRKRGKRDVPAAEEAKDATPEFDQVNPLHAPQQSISGKMPNFDDSEELSNDGEQSSTPGIGRGSGREGNN